MKDYECGQWIGTTTHDNGTIAENILNIEKNALGIAQVLNVFPENPNLRTVVGFPFKIVNNEFEVILPDINLYDVNSGRLTPLVEYIKEHPPQGPLPSRFRYKVTSPPGPRLSGSFTSDLGIGGTFDLINSINSPPAKADYDFSWDQFKEFIAKKYLASNQVIFRGQSNNRHKLRTLFHRAGRNNLIAYLKKDVQDLCHAVNAISHFYYKTTDGEMLGALLSLAQHHGYPTPLLDWTASPYIAAFFAFDGLSSERESDSIRIFIFDRSNWPTPQSARQIIDPMPGIVFYQFPAYNNPRYIPQQSIASFSNVDDMERFIESKQPKGGKKHLLRIDIPHAERKKALEELWIMGIHAGSLFPGIDGTCRSLKDRYFS